MSNQATQKETIKYIKEEDFMNSSLSRGERKVIKDLHREVKQYLKEPQGDIRKRAAEFEKYTKQECSSGTYDYYADVIKFLKADRPLKIIWGYSKYSLNTPTLWKWMEKILEVKNNIVNY